MAEQTPIDTSLFPRTEGMISKLEGDELPIAFGMMKLTELDVRDFLIQEAGRQGTGKKYLDGINAVIHLLESIGNRLLERGKKDISKEEKKTFRNNCTCDTCTREKEPSGK